MTLQVDNGHAQAVARVAANGQRHLLLPRALPSPVPDRQIVPADLACGNHLDQSVHGFTGLCHHHQATGVLV